MLQPKAEAAEGSDYLASLPDRLHRRGQKLAAAHAAISRRWEERARRLAEEAEEARRLGEEALEEAQESARLALEAAQGRREAGDAELAMQLREAHEKAARLEVEVAETKGLKLEAKKAEAALQRQQAHAHQLQAEVVELQEKLAASQGSEQLEAALEAAQAEGVRLRDALAAAEAARSAAEEEVARGAGLAAEHQGLLARHDELQGELKRATASTRTLHERKEQLEGQLGEREAELGLL